MIIVILEKIIYNAISYNDSTASGNSVRDTLFSAYCQSFNVIITKMQYFIQQDRIYLGYHIAQNGLSDYNIFEKNFWTIQNGTILVITD